MSPYIAFILGGVAGALIYKVIYDSVAKRKRSAFIKSVVEASSEIVKSLGSNNDSEEAAKTVEDNIVEFTNTGEMTGNEFQSKN